VRKNCSSDQETLLKFEAEGREFAKILRSLEQFVRTVKGQNNFWQQNTFLTCSWRFLISNKSEQLEFKLKKNIVIKKHAGKVRKCFLFQLVGSKIDFQTFLLTSNCAKSR
jgi:hypothetical protein